MEDVSILDSLEAAEKAARGGPGPENTALIALLRYHAADLIAVARAAQEFHETFWNPWRSARSDAMTADKVADAYGEMRRALAPLTTEGSE